TDTRGPRSGPPRSRDPAGPRAVRERAVWSRYRGPSERGRLFGRALPPTAQRKGAIPPRPGQDRSLARRDRLLLGLAASWRLRVVEHAQIGPPSRCSVQTPNDHDDLRRLSNAKPTSGRS